MINSSRLHSAYMISEQEFISYFFPPIISFNRFWPLLYYLFLQNHFIISVSLFPLEQLFMTVPKHFITWYLCQENISKGEFCLGVVCFACKNKTHHLFSCCMSEIFLTLISISVSFQLQNLRNVPTVVVVVSKVLILIMIYISCRWSQSLGGLFVPSYCTASSISNLLCTIHHL